VPAGLPLLFGAFGEFALSAARPEGVLGEVSCDSLFRHTIVLHQTRRAGRVARPAIRMQKRGSPIILLRHILCKVEMAAAKRPAAVVAFRSPLGNRGQLSIG
jgi:hypothetical protein